MAALTLLQTLPEQNSLVQLPMVSLQWAGRAPLGKGTRGTARGTSKRHLLPSRARARVNNQSHNSKKKKKSHNSLFRECINNGFLARGVEERSVAAEDLCEWDC